LLREKLKQIEEEKQDLISDNLDKDDAIQNLQQEMETLKNLN